MAGRKGVTFDQVHQAMTELLRDGATPTVRSVREVIGAGSYSTIGDHMALAYQRVLDAGTAGLPNGVPETLGEPFKALWDQALSEAESGMEALRQQIHTEADHVRTWAQAAEQRAHDAETLVTQLRKQLADEYETVHTLRGQLNAAQTSAQQRRDDLEQTQQTHAATIDQLKAQHAGQIEDLQARTAERHNELAQQLIQARSEAADHKQHLAEREAQLLKQVDDARQAQKAAEARSAEVAAARDARGEAIDALNSDNQRLNTLCHQQQQQLARRAHRKRGGRRRF